MSLWRGRDLLLAFLLLAFLPVVACSEDWRLLRDGAPVGGVQITEKGGDTYVAVGEMARLLGYSAKSLNDGLLINKGPTNLQIIPNAAAVWLGYDIIPLMRKAFVSDGRWWMDSESALVVMEKLLAKSGDGAKLLWRGLGSGAGQVEMPATQEPPVQQLKPAQPIQVVPDVAPVFEATQSEEASFRWGVHEDRVRLVVETSQKVPLRPTPDGLELSFGSKPQVASSPDPSVLVKVKAYGKGWTVVVEAPGWDKNSFELSDPHRIVADFMRPNSAPPVTSTPTVVVPSVPKPAPAGKKRPLVVVDPGHGGKDPGAVAHGYREKDLALKISQRLVKNLQALGLDAKLTRADDRYLLLRTRTELANQWDADAFVSVHLNALPKGRHAKGVEIYLMALPTDKDAMALAKIENAELAEGSNGQGDDKTSLLLSILGDMQQNNKIQESTKFAEAIFSSGQSGKLPMRRVAQAPFFVLRGAAMPAVLIETGFISESSEARMLADPSYQERLAKSLAKGIKEYLK